MGTAPTTVSTFWPPLTIIRVGMLRMPYWLATLGFSSVLSLNTLILPSNSLAISSTIGATMRQGPHHGAQKSISTGKSLLSTSCSKEASVTAAELDILAGSGFCESSKVVGTHPAALQAVIRAGLGG